MTSCPVLCAMGCECTIGVGCSTLILLRGDSSCSSENGSGSGSCFCTLNLGMTSAVFACFLNAAAEAESDMDDARVWLHTR